MQTEQRCVTEDLPLEINLTFMKAVEIAQGAEAAEKSSKQLQADDIASVGHIPLTAPNCGKVKSRNSRSCYHCVNCSVP